MGLYNFKRQFEAHIRSGRKRHTIRGYRKYPDKPGNTLHLYTGLRTKNARLIMRTMCTNVQDVRIEEEQRGLDSLISIRVDGRELNPGERQSLAYRDGFGDFKEMMHFWKGRLPFSGQIIHWKFKYRRKRTA